MNHFNKRLDIVMYCINMDLKIVIFVSETYEIINDFKRKDFDTFVMTVYVNKSCL